jgi:hypothetical protein
MPENAEPKRFFVVWSPQGGPPVVRFASFNEARSAAIRLSNKHTGQDFFVLASCWGRVGTPSAGPEATAAGPPTPDPDPPEPE